MSGFFDQLNRWFPPSRADSLGVSFLLYTDEKEFGTLNFYSHRPGAFTEESERAGVILASHAAVALSAARTHAQMEQAVATRHQIG
ncbi:GAF domain-containing protein [Streptomyces californicus]|uniref:GAF domain-containing protein n=1 Tax=Streptomyces californicus TaxID=67351 RepID=UPI003F547AC5